MKPTADTLLVTPYLGEFGWELMNWQARVRWVIHHHRYERVVICTSEDRAALYRGIQGETRIEVHCMEIPVLPGKASEDRRVLADGTHTHPLQLLALTDHCVESAREKLNLGHFDVMSPTFGAHLWPATSSHQRFQSFRESIDLDHDVLLVPRLRDSAPERNLPPEWWKTLAAELRNKNLTVGWYPNNLRDAITKLSASRLAIGASTGGLHLASLCKCPHLVWGSDDSVRWTSLGMTNRQRYQTFWNPFGTPCSYAGCGWQPSVQFIVEQTMAAIDHIGLKSEHPTPRSSSLSYRLRRTVASRVYDENRLRMPYRFRKLIMERVL